MKDETGKANARARSRTKPFVGMAFKIVEDPFGQLTFMRIYQGTIKKGEMYSTSAPAQRPLQPHREDARRQARRDRHGRGRRHRRDHGHRLRQRRYLRRRTEVLHAGKHVRARAGDQGRGHPASRADADKMGKALQRFRKEDPTFRVFTDEETNETIIAGMGELHLDIYVERIRREYKVEVEVGAPKVSYREARPPSRVQLQAQEADRWFGPIRPHRRQAEPDPKGGKTV
jgi:elongation factor G